MDPDPSRTRKDGEVDEEEVEGSAKVNMSPTGPPPPPALIRCKKCGVIFPPNQETRGTWDCISCCAKNANLKRHYRSVADLFILGLIASLIILGLSIGNIAPFRLVLAVCQMLLLLIGIVSIYRAKTPWADARIKALIWVVFGLAFLMNVVAPFFLRGHLNIPALVVYAVVFPYLFWLNVQAARCSVPRA